jgi:predicted ATP-grasp superfamily ATP-dependent carboligase
MLRFLFALSADKKLNGCVIYPTTDEMVKLLSINKIRLEQHYKIPVPEWSTTRMLHDKKLTYELAAKLDIPHPETLCPSGEEELMREIPLRFPVIVKPRTRGLFLEKTGRKALLCRNKQELIGNYRLARTVVAAADIMAQELVGGGPSKLYSFCSLFQDGKAIAKLVARRPRQHPMDFGRASTFVEIVDIPELEEIGSRLLANIGYCGLSEVEFMWDTEDRKYKLIEVNARTWGWHTIGNQIGVDFPFLLYQNLTTGNKVIQESVSHAAKWLRILTDTPTALREVLCGRLSPGKYLASLKGKKEYAVWSLEDPAPFLLEILLLPYLLKTRGY